MAIYHLSTKPIARSSGRSATASIAYRAGVEMTDERTGTKHDYSNRGGVVMSKCFVYDKDDFKPVDRNKLWNNAELTEKRKDARTAREIVVNLPHELSEKDREKLVDNFAKDFAKSYGVAVDYAIHTPDKEGDNRNHHAHIMMTTRAVSLDKDNTPQLGDKTLLELSNKKLKELGKPSSQAQIKKIRARWSERANNALEMAGREERIDHRSHKDRGLDIKPTVKMGWEQSKLEKQGIRTPRGDINRQIRAENAHIIALQSEIRILKAEKQPSQAQIRPTEPHKTLERTKPNKTPQNANMSRLEGQTPHQAREFLHQYDMVATAKAEQLRKTEVDRLTKKMGAIAKQYHATKEQGEGIGGLAKKMFGGKSKHDEQLTQLAKQHKAIKNKKEHAQTADFKPLALKAMQEANPQAMNKYEQARQTLKDQASYKYGSQEGQRGRQYTGEITKVSRFGAIQTTPTGRKIYHELEDLDRVPDVGEQVKITYGDKSAAVEMADRTELAKQHQEHQKQMEQRYESRGMER